MKYGIVIFVLFSMLLSADEVVTHKKVVTISKVGKPAYLSSYIDQVFGSKVTRVTGDLGSLIPGIDARWSDIARQNYPKNAAWNADQTLLFLQRHNGFPAMLFLDGKNFKPTFGRNSCPGDEIRWHPTKADIMVYVKNNVLGYWNVRTDEKEILQTFDTYSEFLIGPWEGNLSLDGTKIALFGKKGSKKVAFAYDIEKKQKYPDLDLNGVTVDWASVSASGKYIIVNGNFSGKDGDESQVYTLAGKKVGKVWDTARPSHYDLTLDENGDDIAVGGSKRKPDDGRVLKRRLKDGKVTVLTKGGYAGHVSTRNVLRPGWAYVTYQYTGPNWGPYWGEAVAVKLDGSFKVERIAHLHSNRVDYLTEAHVVPSPDGKYIIWASAWGVKNGRPVGAFVAEKAPLKK